MKEIEEGRRSLLFRSKDEIMKAKREKKVSANTWYLKGKTTGTGSCLTTPGGKLRNETQLSIVIDLNLTVDFS